MIIASATTGIVALFAAGSMFFPSESGTNEHTASTQIAQQRTIQMESTPPPVAVQTEQPRQAHNGTIAQQHGAVAVQQQPTARQRVSQPQQRATEHSTTPLVDVRGIRTMELSDSELLALGTERVQGGIKVYNRASNGMATHMTFSMQGMSFNPTEHVQSPTEFYSSPYLRMITDDRGVRRMRNYNEDTPENATANKPKDVTIIFLPNNNDINQSKVIEVQGVGEKRTTVQRAATPQEIEEHLQTNKRHEELDKNLNDYIRVNRWIAVSVPSDIASTEKDDATTHWRPDLILWFEPTPELVAALPERYRQVLQQELHIAENTDAHTTPTSGDGFLGVWRTQAGALTTSSVSPNPTKGGNITIGYTLAEQRTITINLRTLAGSVVQPLLVSQQKRAGSWSETVQISSLSPGMYILTIETNKGEHAVQRLIVE